MCSICGGNKGSFYDPFSQYIWESSINRGRDDHGQFSYKGSWIGNHRAIPTTEVENPLERQPVGMDPKIVFNGIISNAEELGVREGEADTSILPRRLRFSSLSSFRDSLSVLKGSYAIAVLFSSGRIWLACNYKPIWVADHPTNPTKKYFSSLAGHFHPELAPYRFPPYWVADIENIKGGFPIERKQSPKTLVICSGGLDSTAVAAFACAKHGPENVKLIHFNYGCLATSNEIKAIKKIASYLKCDADILTMPSYGGSSLLDKNANIATGISGAEYAHEWVPARNLVMLSMTVAYAEAKSFGHIYLGTNLEEAGAYPDNEEQFILDFSSILYGAVQNGVKIEIHTPLGGLMKHEIISFGNRYNTPFHLTWSCYKDGEKHCGECGPCFMRKTAFIRNGLKDPVFKKNDDTRSSQ